MRKISRYNNPKNYTHRFFANGLSEEKTPIAVYAIGLVIMKFWYLDKEFPQIIAALKARK